MRRVSLIVALLSCLICSCENEDNNPPEIIGMTASPDTIFILGVTTITVLATDVDGDRLSYDFYADTGVLANQEGNVTMWGAPWAEWGTYSVSCIVSDGKDTVTDSVSILVKPGI
jgi:hypothetical protein